MNATSLSLLIVGCGLWGLLLIVHAVRPPFSEISEFELKRRSQSGDGDAQGALLRLMLRPRIVALLFMLETLCIVLVSAFSVLLFGWLLGSLIAVVAIAQRAVVARLPLVQRTAQKIYSHYETWLLRTATSWGWLDWFQPTTSAKATPLQFGSKEEFAQVIKTTSLFSAEERARLASILVFDNKQVKDIMTPASMIESIAVSESLGPIVLDTLHKTGHSRFPVLDGDIHHVVGMLYLRDLIDLKTSQATVKAAMEPRVHYIHESHSLEKALHGFLRSRHHLFVVVNDYRETVGLLSLEDVIESMIGKKIVDEFDQYDDLRAVAASNPRKNNLPHERTDI